MQCNILLICISYGIMSSLANDEHPIAGYDEIDDNELSERKLLLVQEPLRDYLGYYGEFISEKDSDWCPKKCESVTTIYESPNLRSYCTCEENKNTVKHDCPAHEIFNRTLGVCSQLSGGGTASCVLKNHNCPKNHRGLIAHPDSNLFQSYILCMDNLVIVAICDDMYYYDSNDRECKKLHIEDTYLSASDCPIIPGIECSEPGIIPMNNGQVFESQSLRCADCFYLCSVRDMDTFELKISCENITVYEDTEYFRMGKPHSLVIENETTNHGGFSNEYGPTSIKSGSSSSKFDTEDTTPKHKTRSESSTGENTETTHTSNVGDKSSPITHTGENSKNDKTIGNSSITMNRGVTGVDSTIEDGKHSMSGSELHNLNNKALSNLDKIKFEHELGDLKEKHKESGKTIQKNTSTNSGGSSSITGNYGTTYIARTTQDYSTINSASSSDEGAADKYTIFNSKSGPQSSEKEQITLKHSTVKTTPEHKFIISSTTIRSDRITEKQFKINSSSSSPFTSSGVILKFTTESSSIDGGTTRKHIDIKSESGSSIAAREIITPKNTTVTYSPTRNEETTLKHTTPSRSTGTKIERTTHDYTSTKKESISSNFLTTDSGGTVKKHVINGNSYSKIINNGKNVPEHSVLNSSSIERSEKNTDKYTTKNSGSGPYITEIEGATPKKENFSSLRDTGDETTTKQYNVYKSSDGSSIAENKGTTSKNTSEKMSANENEETLLKYTTNFIKGTLPKNSTPRTGITTKSTTKHNATGEYTTIKSSGMVQSSTIRPNQNHISINTGSIPPINDSKGSIPKPETSRVISGSGSSKIIDNDGYRKTTDYSTINVENDSSNAKSEKTIPKHNVPQTHATGINNDSKIINRQETTFIYLTSNGSMTQKHTTLSSLSSSNGEGITKEYTTTKTGRGSFINEGKGSTGMKGSTGSLPKHTTERSSTKSIHNHNSTNSGSSSINNDSSVTGRDHNKTTDSLNTGRKDYSTIHGGKDSSISGDFTKSEETIPKHNVPQTHATGINNYTKIKNRQETTPIDSTSNGSMTRKDTTLSSLSSSNGEGITKEYTTINTGRDSLINEGKGSTGMNGSTGSLPKHTTERSSTKSIHNHNSTDSGSSSINNDSSVTGRDHNKTTDSLNTGRKDYSTIHGGKDSSISGDFTKSEETLPKHNVPLPHATGINNDTKIINRQETTTIYSTSNGSMSRKDTTLSSSSSSNGERITKEYTTINTGRGSLINEGKGSTGMKGSTGSLPKHTTERSSTKSIHNHNSTNSGSSSMINDSLVTGQVHNKTTDSLNTGRKDYSSMHGGRDSSISGDFTKSGDTISKHNVPQTHVTGTNNASKNINRQETTTIYSTSNGSMTQKHTTMSSLSSSNGEEITKEYTTINTGRGSLNNEGKASTGKKRTGSLPKHITERSSTKSIHNHNSTNSGSSSINNDNSVTGRDHYKTTASLNTGRKDYSSIHSGKDSSISGDFTKSEETIPKYNVPQTHATDINNASKIINRQETTTIYSTSNGSMTQKHTTMSSLSSSNGEGITKEYTTTKTGRGSFINEGKGSTGMKGSTGSLPKHTTERSSTKSIHNHNSTDSGSSSINNDNSETDRDHNKTTASLNTGRKDYSTKHGGKVSSISGDFTKSEDTISKHNVPQTHATVINNASKTINRQETTTIYSTSNGSMTQKHTTMSSLSSSNGEGITKEYTTINTGRGSLINEGKASTGKKRTGSLPKHITERSSTKSIHNHNSTNSGSSSINNDNSVTGRDHHKTTESLNTGREDYSTIHGGKDSSISGDFTKSEKTIPKYNVPQTHATGINNASKIINRQETTTIYSTSNGSMTQKHTTMSSLSSSNGEGITKEYTTTKTGRGSFINEGKGSTGMKGSTGSLPKHTTERSSTKSIHNHNSTDSGSSSINNDNSETDRDHNKTTASLNTGRKDYSTKHGGKVSSISGDFTKSEDTISKHNVPQTHATVINNASKTINRQETTTIYSTSNGSMTQKHTTMSSLSSSNGEGITKEYTTINTGRGSLINEGKASTGKKRTGSLPKHITERSSTKSIHNHNSTNSGSSSINNDNSVTGRDHHKTTESLNTGREDYSTIHGGKDSSISGDFTKSEKTIPKYNVPQTHATGINNASKIINRQETTTIYSTSNGSMTQKHTTMSSLSSSNGEGITKEYTTTKTGRGSLINEGKESTGMKGSTGSLPKHTTERNSTKSIHNHNSTDSGSSSINNDNSETGRDHNKTTASLNTGRKDYSTIHGGKVSSISGDFTKSEDTISKHNVPQTHATVMNNASKTINRQETTTIYSTSNGSMTQKHTTMSSLSSSNGEGITKEYTTINTGRGSLINESKASTGKKRTGSLPTHITERSSTKSIHSHNSTNSGSSSINNDNSVTGRDHHKTTESLNTGREDYSTIHGGKDSSISGDFTKSEETIPKYNVPQTHATGINNASKIINRQETTTIYSTSNGSMTQKHTTMSSLSSSNGEGITKEYTTTKTGRGSFINEGKGSTGMKGSTGSLPKHTTERSSTKSIHNHNSTNSGSSSINNDSSVTGRDHNKTTDSLNTGRKDYSSIYGGKDSSISGDFTKSEETIPKYNVPQTHATGINNASKTINRQETTTIYSTSNGSMTQKHTTMSSLSSSNGEGITKEYTTSNTGRVSLINEGKGSTGMKGSIGSLPKHTTERSSTKFIHNHNSTNSGSSSISDSLVTGQVHSKTTGSLNNGRKEYTATNGGTEDERITPKHTVPRTNAIDSSDSDKINSERNTTKYSTSSSSSITRRDGTAQKYTTLNSSMTSNREENAGEFDEIKSGSSSSTSIGETIPKHTTNKSKEFTEECTKNKIGTGSTSTGSKGDTSGNSSTSSELSSSDRPCPSKGFFRYNHSCSIHYECYYSERHKKIVASRLYECPNCLQFNAKSSRCDLPENVPECSIHDPTYQYVEGHRITKPVKVCTGPGIFADPVDSNNFYECVDIFDENINYLTVSSCPSETHFNPRTKQCEREYVRQKNYNLLGDCKTKKYAFHKSSCQKFFYCVDETKSVEMKCLDGYMFNGQFCQLKVQTVYCNWDPLKKKIYKRYNKYIQ